MSDTEKTIKQISTGIRKALGPDRFPIRRELDRIRKRANKGAEAEKTARALEKLSKRLERSIARRRDRVRAVPRLSYPEQLPITDKKDEIVAAIRHHPVVIVSGETGSGKTTQIPKFCLAAGRGIDGKIGCTQPRRIAAVTVAARISEELGEEPGRSVGYKIRFHDKTGPDAFIKVMTDGILLAETQNDPMLRAYDTLIVDEAHERSLNIDFLLGILKTLLKKRRDLKVVITSATIDTEKFAAAFDGAPVIEVSGRTFPVETRWEEDLDADSGEATHAERAVAAVDRIQRESREGDILVFMPTEQDIRDTMEVLAGRKYARTLVLPLFARLTAADQAKVFSARAARKIIVATNIAETSLTIPGIKYVVDTGLARVSQYNPRTRTTALPVIDISRSSADQRMGRCGRVRNGVCIRLFSEDDYNARPRFTRPEILRANLAEVILRMISLKLPEISGFPFLDRPPEKAIKDGLDLLMELGAITQAAEGEKTGGQAPAYALTKQGRQMAAMPLDPGLSRMLIEAKKEGCLPEATVIVAALSIQDPRERPAEKQAEADRAHRVFSDPLSDFVSLLNIWNQARRAAGNGPGSTSRMKRFCTTGFLSFRRMREWRDIHAQILTILKEHRWLPEGGAHPRDLAAPSKSDGKKEFGPLYGAVHRSVLSGFLSNIARRKEGNFYQAGKDREAMIFPGSGLFGKAGAWVVAAEMVETSRLYARSVANIDPDWIEPLAGDRCRRTYLEPHWEKKRGQVVATCQVSLYGLILSSDRKVAFGPVDPDQASEIFIREALLAGETRGRFPFIAHNLRLVEGIQEMEDKVRRRDILIGEEDLAVFYAQRLSGVFDERTLASRIKKAGGDRWLRMREEELIRHRPNEKEMALYPDRITLGGQRFSCDYEFSPGSDRDGVTVKIPAGTAPGVPAEALDWLVPGLIAEKIAALVKGLPKAYRRQLAPVSGAIDTITSEMPTFKGALVPALSRFIHARFGVRIPPDAWSGAALPEHLKMRIAVTDHRGKTIAAGRDPSILKQAGNAGGGEDAFSAAKTAHERTDLRAWDFGDLPESLEVTDGRGHQWTAFPALVPDKEAAGCVHLRLFLDKTKADIRHRQGIRALSSGLLSKDLKFLKRSLKISGYHAQKAAYAQGAQALEDGIYEKTVSELFEKNIRTRADFEALIESGARQLITTGESILSAILAVLDAVHETRATLYELENKSPKSGHVQILASEIRNDLEALAPPSFVTLYDPDRLPHLVRYLQAMGVRARKGALEFARDRKWREQIEPFTTALKKLLDSLTPESSDARRKAVESFFWMLEEYKISVFAQEIKTDGPVSAKRLRKKLKEIEALY